MDDLFLNSIPQFDVVPHETAPMLLAYLFISLLVWVIMMDLSEMTCHVPVKGVSVPYLIHRFLCPSLAFASGWNYW